ncbi:condensation domain-containing protein [Scytonema sp. NUACC26]|uniref:condensation domain-containing protein n=1 Tax=Scytonema sp. NUACC26 TaxID=3140176 RepID=UPI0034DBB83E
MDNKKDELLKRRSKLSSTQRELLEKRLRGEVDTISRLEVIPKRSQTSPAPLSFAQQRLWFLHQLDPSNPNYNELASIQLTGVLNVVALEQSLNEIVRRHEVLRTTFETLEEQPVQVIHPTIIVALPVVNLCSWPQAMRQVEIERLTAEIAQKPFDLVSDLLLRAMLLQTGVQEYLLLFAIHHIVIDGWSVGVLIRELAALYEAFSTNKISSLPELPIQYADYAVWQRQWMHKAGVHGRTPLQTQLVYWKQQLGGSLPILQLPVDQPRPAVQTFRGATQSLVLPKTLTEALKNFSQREGVTLFMTLLAVFKTLLYYYTKQNDIILGSPIANRNRAEIEGLIGFFVNTLVLRTDFSGNPNFRELLGRVREVVIGAYAHQDLPFNLLVKELEPERDFSRNPLFQVAFTFQNAPVPDLKLAGLTLSFLEYDRRVATFDLLLDLWEKPEGLVGMFRYKTDLFDACTFRRMVEQFETLLQEVVTQPDVRLNVLEKVLVEADRQQQIQEKKKLEETRQKKLENIKRRTKRQALSISQERLIDTQLLTPEKNLPLMIQPTVAGVNLITWAQNNRQFIQTHLLKHGGILFRNFKVNEVAEFEHFIRIVSGELLEYGERSSPRSFVSGKIYTSTDHPATQSIFLHNENSYQYTWPLKIFFFCITPAQQGGETLIADVRKVYERIHPTIRNRFMQKQVMYVRNFGDGFGLPWQEVFQTTNRAKVEEYCRTNGIEVEWKNGNRLRTRQVRSSVAKHPQTDEIIWFNHAVFFHVSTLERTIRDVLLAEFQEEDLPHNTYYGDGSIIEQSVLDEIREAYQKETVSFPWQSGDILMLDNMLTAHGRAPFLGSRKIVVGMTEPFSNKNI